MSTSLLTPRTTARLLTLAALRVSGGPGSGNWGHAGRPGQRGGSASDDAPEVNEAPLPDEKKLELAKLFKEGKSTYAIAKQLGMRYSHVKLYVDKLKAQDPNQLQPPPAPKVKRTIGPKVSPEEYEGLFDARAANVEQRQVRAIIDLPNRGMHDMDARSAVYTIHDICKEQGYDPAYVGVSPSYEFKVGGQDLRSAGSYHTVTGQIDLHEGALRSHNALATTLSHEIQHDKWQEFLSYTKRSKDSAEAKAFNKFLDLGTEKLKEEDGVTRYSETWWQDRRSSTFSGLYNAINETLAEMEAVRYGAIATRKISPHFLELKNVIDNHYRTHVRAKRMKGWKRLSKKNEDAA